MCSLSDVERRLEDIERKLDLIYIELSKIRAILEKRYGSPIMHEAYPKEQTRKEVRIISTFPDELGEIIWALLIFIAITMILFVVFVYFIPRLVGG